MKYTEKFHLAKPDGTDRVDVSVLNSNMDIIDNNLGSSGGQSDWNVNDSSSSAYIKNRPFYAETITIDAQSKSVVFNNGDAPILIDDYAPDLSGHNGESVTVNVIPPEGEQTSVTGTVKNMVDLVGFDTYGIAFLPAEEPSGYFISGVDEEQAPSDTSSLFIYNQGIYADGTQFIFNFPFHYNNERIVRLDNKYLDIYDFTGDIGSDDIRVSPEITIGATRSGEPLYKRTYTITVPNNSLSDTTELDIGAPGTANITNPYIQDARLDIYVSTNSSPEDFSWNMSVTPFYSATSLFDGSDTTPRYFNVSTIRQAGKNRLRHNISDNISYVDKSAYNFKYILTVTIFYTKSAE